MFIKFLNKFLAPFNSMALGGIVFMYAPKDWNWIGLLSIGLGIIQLLLSHAIGVLSQIEEEL